MLKSIVIKQTGFTLIELLVSLLIFSLILLLALPSMKGLLMNSRLNANTDLLVNALNYARSTALSQSINVSVCPLQTINSVTCGTNWNTGWMVVAQTASGSNILLQSQQFSSSDPKLSSSTSSVVFDSHGLASTQSNFTLCDSRGATLAHSIELLATGYIQKGDIPGQAVWNNNALTCP